MNELFNLNYKFLIRDFIRKTNKNDKKLVNLSTNPANNLNKTQSLHLKKLLSNFSINTIIAYFPINNEFCLTYPNNHSIYIAHITHCTDELIFVKICHKNFKKSVLNLDLDIKSLIDDCDINIYYDKCSIPSINPNTTNKSKSLNLWQELKKHDTNAVMLIPCIGCMLDGVRIGYGKGYYDRFFNIKPKDKKHNFFADYKLVDNQIKKIIKIGIVNDLGLINNATIKKLINHYTNHPNDENIKNLNYKNLIDNFLYDLKLSFNSNNLSILSKKVIDPWDEKMNYIIAPKSGIINCKN